MILIIILGICATLGYFLPQMLWNIQWNDIISLLQNNDAGKISEIMKELGLINKTASEVATEKILIITAIVLAVFLVLFMLYRIYKNSKKKHKK